MDNSEPSYEFESICQVQDFDPRDPLQVALVTLVGSGLAGELQQLVMGRLGHLGMDAGRKFKLTIRMERVAEPPADQLKKQFPSLTISETARVMRLRRSRICELCDGGELKWFPEGARRRIVKASILDYQERKAREAIAGSVPSEQARL